jgi:proteasome lid subunit RPN8/RPN11
MDLLLSPGILEQVIEHAKSCHPIEGCGLLVGRDRGERFIPVTNLRGSETEFEMDPAELITVLRDIRETGEMLVAIYHSHPRGPAELSKRDIEQAYYPKAAQLIVSLAEPERPLAAAFRIEDGQAIPVEVHAIV